MAKFRRRRQVSTNTVGIGMNLSGLEWNSSLAKAAIQGLNNNAGCNVPALGFIKWLANQGVNTVRIPVAWEFLQPCLYDSTSAVAQGCFPFVKQPGDLHREIVYVFQRLLDECAANNIKLVIDVHNYGTYYDLYTYGATGANDGITQRLGGSTEYFKYSNAASSATVTFTANSTTITTVSGSFPIHEPIKFIPVNGATLPSNLNTSTVYYTTSTITTTAGSVSLTPGGAPITFADAGSGTININSPTTGPMFARTFGNGQLTANHMRDLFTRLVNTFDSHPALLGYGLMNEVGISAGVTEASWVSIANQTIAAIRSAGSTKAVFVDGPYANAVSNPYTSASFSAITDSANNTYREIHQYLDANRSGIYSEWEYDSKRGFCVDVAGVTGNVTAVSGIRAQMLIDAQKLAGRPVWIGETAFLNTSDRYIELSRLFVRAIRQGSTGNHSLAPILWGGSSLAWFPKDYKSEPKMHAGAPVPDPAISIVLNDAGVENAVLCAYVDVTTNTLTVEAVGSLTKTLTVTVACSDAGVTLSKTTLVIKHGVQQFDSLTFTNPVAATATFSFTASRLTAPSSVTILNYADSGSDATQGQRALQRTNSAIFIAGTGRSNFAGDTGQPFEAMVPNSGLSNRRQRIQTALSYSADKVRLVEGNNRLPMWKPYNGDAGRLVYGNHYLGVGYTIPGGGVTNAYGACSTGLTNPNTSPFPVRGSRWHASVTFEMTSVDKYNANRILFAVFAKSQTASVGVVFHTASPYNRVGLKIQTRGNTAQNNYFAATPTVLALNTLHTLTIDYNDGNVSLYVNGVLEVSYTEAANEPLQGTFTAGSTASSQVTLSSFTGFTGYAGYLQVISPVLPAGTWATTTATNGVVNLVNSSYQPVTPISDPVGAAYRLVTYFDTIALFGTHSNYYGFGTAPNGMRVANFSYGAGALSANDITGIAAYFNGRSNASLTTPSNTAAPVLSGIAKVGQTLTVTTGTWSNTPSSYQYQWYRGLYMIPGATTSSYTITNADRGEKIQCAVTAVNASGPSIPVLVRHNLGIPDENATTIFDFASDAVDAVPTGVVAANGGNILVKSTGATLLQGKYIVDQATSTTAHNVYTLTGTTPSSSKAPHKLRVSFEGGNGVAILIQAQQGTTVAGYPGLLQGYYFAIYPNGGTGIYVATASGLTPLAVSQYPDFPSAPMFHVQAMWENGRINSALSADGVNWGRWYTAVDLTYPTATGPCQIIPARGAAAPNSVYIGQITFHG